ncbi:MAG: hypothetical protein ACYCXA_05170 [Actinomycetes bacterium]
MSLPGRSPNACPTAVVVTTDQAVWVAESYRLIRAAPATAAVSSLPLSVTVPGALPVASQPRCATLGGHYGNTWGVALHKFVWQDGDLGLPARRGRAPTEVVEGHPSSG